MPYPHAQWANFDVDEAAAISGILEFLGSLAAGDHAAEPDPPSTGR